MIAETDSLGSRLKTYLYGDDLISQIDSTNTTNTFHYDGLGSTRSLSDNSGEQSDSYDYLAFGEVLNKTGTTENNYLYTGEQFDGDLDQYYLRARYYDQNVGRFTQQDAFLGLQIRPISLNNYADLDPISLFDYSGYATNLTESQIVNTILSTNARITPVNFRVVLRKSGCYAVTYVFDEFTDKGVYLFMDEILGLPYAGKTEVDFEIRKDQHIKEGKRKLRDFLAKFHVDGSIKGGVLREFEQMIIDMFGTPGKTGNPNKTLSNNINSINKAKRDALRGLDKLCK
ncbi:RHS repeat-associated core domain-containing protein [Pseudoalteromonas sp. T1lg24]|uniref:RHS repeat-associated core domain-containing protein n=1 Tax=Pseudoalteromonas sp. T1lg24 TaxID=2077099 RepID=UPI000CF6C0D5|nr:RHS repeat-associated core domain-containing protein [Pseudoalteromonas sp. T1lg24]